MKPDLIPVTADAIKAITLHGDYSKLAEHDRVNVVLNICERLGIAPELNPFNYIPGKDGKLSLYANKSCASQLSSNRKLSVVVAKEEVVLDSVYKVTYRVTEPGREPTEDCGAVSLVYWRAGRGNQPGEWARIEGAGLADAVMKAHTKAKRRAILSHCGLGLPDREEEPIVILPADATVKEPEEDAGPGPAPKSKPANGAIEWVGAITEVRPEELPGGKACWTLLGDGAVEFRTIDPDHAQVEIGKRLTVAYKVNTRGSKVIESIGEAE